ncbi:MAG: nitrophenyl compound nitroreductase subunit ArsF family protein [bacterium]|nr:nitrophenyl compound nitroreductase subunit ArsF family protein [bacterium]
MTTKTIVRNLLLLAVVASLGAFGLQKLGRQTGRLAAADSLAVAGPTGSVKLLYLHGTFRCETCNSIEEQAARAIREDFARQIEAGSLQFASLNVDEPVHEHYAEDFGLVSACLVLTDDRGPYGRWKLLPRTWELVRDPVGFREYVFQETQAFLAGGQ